MTVVPILAGVIGLTLGFAVKRLQDFNAMSIWVWPLMLLAGAAPCLVAYSTLHPGAAVDVAEVVAEKDSVELHVPPDHSLMVTAVLTEESDEPGTDKTHYNLKIKGVGWEVSADGTMKRESATGGAKIDALGQQGIEEIGGKRGSKLGEDLQDRHDLRESGDVTVTVTNWQGLAVEKLLLEVVPSPPSDVVMWSFTVLVTILGLVLGVRDNAERLASDLAFLCLWGVYMRDGVTPLDDWQEVGLALVPAALTGWLGVAAIEYLVINYFHSRAQAAEAEEEAAAPEQEAVVEEPTPRRRGGAAARRRALQDGSSDS
ncbi:MAG TPA: hypothetical protein DFR83_21040 [Deltaproteobacteria bacterium]|nr:hypothetical protein [Deltaproteobacteria bacterium]